MQIILNIIEIILAILLTFAILMQTKGTGLSSTFGGAGLFYQSKRGAEKVLFTTTVILAVLFSIVSLVSVGLSR